MRGDKSDPISVPAYALKARPARPVPQPRIEHAPRPGGLRAEPGQQRGERRRDHVLELVEQVLVEARRVGVEQVGDQLGRRRRGLLARQPGQQEARVRVARIATENPAEEPDRLARASRQDVVLREALERHRRRRVELDRELHRGHCEVVEAGRSVGRTERELGRGEAGRELARAFEELDRRLGALAIDHQEAEHAQHAEVIRSERERFAIARLGLRELAAVGVALRDSDELFRGSRGGAGLLGLLALHRLPTYGVYAATARRITSSASSRP